MPSEMANVPPNDNVAEMSVLGAILLGTPDAVEDAEAILGPSDFYKFHHGTIFSAMSKLARAKTPVDVITLRDALTRVNMLEEIGGDGYLKQLTEEQFTTANLPHYAKIVRELSIRRSMIVEGARIIQAGYHGDMSGRGLSASTIIGSAIDTLDEMRNTGSPQEMRHIRDWMRESMEAADEREMNGSQMIGVRTGLAALDATILGLEPETLNILAARPSMGKTACAVGMGLHAALSGVHVAIFSQEMKGISVADRILCTRAGVDGHTFRSGQMSKDEWMRISDVRGEMMDAEMYMDDTRSLTVSEIISRTKSHHKRRKIGLLIIDYLQLISMEGGSGDTRSAQIGDATKRLRALSQSISAPILLLAQLNRNVERRDNKRPMLSDLNESGDIEAHADTAMFIYRPAYYAVDKGQSELIHEAEIIVGKNRNGPVGSAKVQFIPRFVRFQDIPYIDDLDEGR